ncbi:MAG: hypothetical protein LBB88_03415 [Planctomycetaceae bacterium]|jgi:hypothetical protein|nr:hypothetical protein [Planctomycetaceae bacterium]
MNMNWTMIIVLLFFVTINGCANRSSERVRIENSLLQANRRLEEALVVTHNQLVDLKRENEMLKANETSLSDINSLSTPIIRQGKGELNPMNSPISPPQVIIPEGSESTTVPDSLKGTTNNSSPKWSPNR